MDEEDLQLREHRTPKGWSMQSNLVGRSTIAIIVKGTLKAHLPS